MRINPKLYKVADEVQPFEVQKLEKRTVELFFMDSFNDIEDEFVKQKGQFATWSSENGNDYRLFLERGYYEAVSDLYSEGVNKIWTDFWDITDAIYKKFSRWFLIPVIVILLGLAVLSFFIGEVGTIIMLCVLFAMVIVYMVASRYMKKKTLEENTKSRDLIIKLLGEKHFDDLLEKQKEYMDSYFDKLNDYDDSLNSTDDSNEESDGEDDKESVDTEEAIDDTEDEYSTNNEDEATNEEVETKKNKENE